MSGRCIGLAAAAVLGLAACSGQPQDGPSGVRKSDAQSWSGADPAYTASGWKAGDKAAWEAQLKERAKGQNEYTRTQ